MNCLQQACCRKLFNKQQKCKDNLHGIQFPKTIIATFLPVAWLPCSPFLTPPLLCSSGISVAIRPSPTICSFSFHVSLPPPQDDDYVNSWTYTHMYKVLLTVVGDGRVRPALGTNRLQLTSAQPLLYSHALFNYLFHSKPHSRTQYEKNISNHMVRLW